MQDAARMAIGSLVVQLIGGLKDEIEKKMLQLQQEQQKHGTVIHDRPLLVPGRR
jgi:hypothetical protein